MLQAERKRWALPAGGGLAGMLGLMVLYFAIVSIAETPAHAWELFVEDRWIVIPIIVGFGVQVALYITLKKGLYLPIHVPGGASMPGASAGTSTLAMVACCAHHVTDVLPLVGLSAAAVFLADYRIHFMVLGLITNLIGIGVMVWLILRERRRAIEVHRVEAAARRMKRTTLFPLALALVVIVLFLAGYVAWASRPEMVSQPYVPPPLDSDTDTSLSNAPVIVQEAPASGIVDPQLFATTNNSSLTREVDGGSVVVEVTPLNWPLQAGQPLAFEVALNTHSVELGYDLSALSVLHTSNELEEAALEWNGPASGGHHVSGILTFPAIALDDAVWLELEIRDVAGVPVRTFRWDTADFN